MIGSLRGTVLDREAPDTVLVEVGGVGYLVSVLPRTFAECAPGIEVFLHVHHLVREDRQTLFGFIDRAERRSFEALLTAHGVGPGLALAILTTHPPAQLEAVLATDDLDALCLVPGVGRKTAARLLVELKGRVVVGGLDALAPGSAAIDATGGALGEARAALATLGYAPDEVRAVLATVDVNDVDAAAIVKAALRQLARA